MLKVTVIAFGEKMPGWINEATLTYTQRLQEYVQLKLISIPIEKRHKSQSDTILMEKEARKIEPFLPQGAYLIALDSRGKQFTSKTLATHLEKLQLQTPHLCLIIGGPDGIDQSLLQRMDATWSLSSLTFPHPLARVILLETLYRAFSILHGHPYHRA